MRDYWIFAGLCVLVFFLLDRKFKFPWPYKLFFYVVSMGSYLLGNYFGLYQQIDIYDKIQHFVNPLFMALLAGHAISSLCPILGKNGKWVMALTTVISLITIYECYEWIWQSLGIDKYNMLGVFNSQGQMLLNGLDDTILDMLAGVSGALIGALAGWIGDWVNER